MPIDVICSSCGKQYRVPDERAGHRFACKQCGVPVDVPQDVWGQQGGGDPAGAFAPNPYAAPYAASSGGTASADRSAALSRTMLCAIFLYIVAGMSVVNHVAGAIMTLAGVNTNPFLENMQGGNANQAAGMIGGVVGGVVGTILDVLVILGAYNLHKLKSYPLAMTGAIVACIPCCGPCVVLGMPFGIWALVLLNNAEIKRHFN